MDMENGEGERDIYIYILHLGDIYCTWEREREREVWTRWQRLVWSHWRQSSIWTHRWRFRLGSVLWSRSVLLRPSSMLRSRSVCHGANLLGMKKEVKMRRGLTLMWEEAKRGKWEEGKVLLKIWGRNEMKQGSCNGNNPTWLWCDNALVRGPQRHLIYHICHWVSVFNFRKHQKPVLIFHHPHPKFWDFESWK